MKYECEAVRNGIIQMLMKCTDEYTEHFMADKTADKIREFFEKTPAATAVTIPVDLDFGDVSKGFVLPAYAEIRKDGNVILRRKASVDALEDI